MILDKICPDFEFDDNLNKLYTNGVTHFTGQKGNWDLSKGLLIIGSVGSGKTLFMKVMKILTNNIFGINMFRQYTSREITNGFLSSGYEFLDRCLYNENTSTRKKPTHISIDDIGRMDETVTHFGTKKNVIQELLADRYEIFKTFGKHTFVTTNLNSEQLEQYYGEWIRSRAREMFNIVKITGTDKRK